MKSVKLVIPSRFFLWKNSLSDISRKWILPVMVRAGTTLFIFGKTHFLLISEIKFFHETKGNESLHGIHAMHNTSN